MRRGFSPELLKAASAHVLRLGTEKRGNVPAPVVTPAHVAAVAKAIRTAPEAAAPHVGAEFLSKARDLGTKALKSAGSGTKLIGGLLGAGTVVSAIPQMVAQSRQGYSQIKDEYARQGGL